MAIEVKHFTPDSPEFAEIAATITHVSKVRKGMSNETTVLYCDSEKSAKYRRNESQGNI